MPEVCHTDASAQGAANQSPIKTPRFLVRFSGFFMVFRMFLGLARNSVTHFMRHLVDLVRWET